MRRILRITARLSAPLTSTCALALMVLACKSSENRASGATPSATATATGSVVLNALSRPPSPYASNSKYVPTPAPTRIPLPSGPRLAIAAGKGVGPIRLGATRATIERHMDRPCDVVTTDLCRYLGRAVDFHLTEGVVTKIVVHRRDRPAGKDKNGQPATFGIFNGALPPDFEVMMKQKVIMDHLGPPQNKETVAGTNPFDTLERHHYDGMTVEYDRYDNGQVVLGAVIIEPFEGARPPPVPSSRPGSP